MTEREWPESAFARLALWRPRSTKMTEREASGSACAAGALTTSVIFIKNRISTFNWNWDRFKKTHPLFGWTHPFFVLYPFKVSFTTKRELLSTKSSLFVYPSRRVGISSAPAGLDIITATPCISSRAGVYFPAAGWYTTLRVDDIPQQVADDIQCFALMIYTPLAWFGHDYFIDIS